MGNAIVPKGNDDTPTGKKDLTSIMPDVDTSSSGPSSRSSLINKTKTAPLNVISSSTASTSTSTTTGSSPNDGLERERNERSDLRDVNRGDDRDRNIDASRNDRERERDRDHDRSIDRDGNSSKDYEESGDFDFNITEGATRRGLMANCEYECSEIFPYLYVAGSKIAESFKVINDLGITRIINCSACVTPNYFESKPQLKYLSLNMLDGRQDDISWFLCEVLRFIDDGKIGGEKILLHCEKGISRSCSYAIAYHMWSTGSSWRNSFNYVKTRRPVCNPNTSFTCNLIEIDELMTGSSKNKGLFFRVSHHLPHDNETPVMKLCRHGDTRKLLVPKTSYLSNGGIFIIRPDKEFSSKIYVHQGLFSNDLVVAIALQMAQKLLGILSEASEVVLVKQGSEPEDFFDAVDKDGPHDPSVGPNYDDLYSISSIADTSNRILPLILPMPTQESYAGSSHSSHRSFSPAAVNTSQNANVGNSPFVVDIRDTPGRDRENNRDVDGDDDMSDINIGNDRVRGMLNLNGSFVQVGSGLNNNNNSNSNGRISSPSRDMIDGYKVGVVTAGVVGGAVSADLQEDVSSSDGDRFHTREIKTRSNNPNVVKKIDFSQAQGTDSTVSDSTQMASQTKLGNARASELPALKSQTGISLSLPIRRVVREDSNKSDLSDRGDIESASEFRPERDMPIGPRRVDSNRSSDGGGDLPIGARREDSNRSSDGGVEIRVVVPRRDNSNRSSDGGGVESASEFGPVSKFVALSDAEKASSVRPDTAGEDGDDVVVRAPNSTKTVVPSLGGQSKQQAKVPSLGLVKPPVVLSLDSVNTTTATNTHLPAGVAAQPTNAPAKKPFTGPKIDLKPVSNAQNNSSNNKTNSNRMNSSNDSNNDLSDVELNTAENGANDEVVVRDRSKCRTASSPVQLDMDIQPALFNSKKQQQQGMKPRIPSLADTSENDASGVGGINIVGKQLQVPNISNTTAIPSLNANLALSSEKVSPDKADEVMVISDTGGESPFKNRNSLNADGSNNHFPNSPERSSSKQKSSVAASLNISQMPIQKKTPAPAPLVPFIAKPSSNGNNNNSSDGSSVRAASPSLNLPDSLGSPIRPRSRENEVPRTPPLKLGNSGSGNLAAEAVLPTDSSLMRGPTSPMSIIKPIKKDGGQIDHLDAPPITTRDSHVDQEHPWEGGEPKLKKPRLFVAAQANAYAGMKWQSLGIYDDDDLIETSMFLLECPPPNQSYLWLGVNLACLEDVAEKSFTANIPGKGDYACIQMQSLLELVAMGELQGGVSFDADHPIILEHQGSESKDFWTLFQKGF